jgi:hypothetical protein
MRAPTDDPFARAVSAKPTLADARRMAVRKAVLSGCRAVKDCVTTYTNGRLCVVVFSSHLSV